MAEDFDPATLANEWRTGRREAVLYQLKDASYREVVMVCVMLGTNPGMHKALDLADALDDRRQIATERMAKLLESFGELLESLDGSPAQVMYAKGKAVAALQQGGKSPAGNV